MRLLAASQTFCTLGYRRFFIVESILHLAAKKMRRDKSFARRFKKSNKIDQCWKNCRYL